MQQNKIEMNGTMSTAFKKSLSRWQNDRQKSWVRGIFHHDNAGPHTVCLTMDCLIRKVKIVVHPPYSPDIRPLRLIDTVQIFLHATFGHSENSRKLYVTINLKLKENSCKGSFWGCLKRKVVTCLPVVAELNATCYW